ncbi:MAG: hypothetical protein CME11_06475 [Gemmatimonadetes bacterium]|nr:hypothetical protein [Gemmatimonadota bacterium]
MSARTFKQLVTALLVVAISWGLASLFSRGGGDSIAATGEIATFFDGVNESSISAVRMAGGAGEIELLPSGDSWTVNGWAIDSGSVTRFFDTLEEAQVGDLVAANPANHRRMGIATDNASRIELEVDGLSRTLLMGTQGPRFSTSYIRLPEADEVYLLQSNLSTHMARNLDDWRNRKMIAIDTSRVVRLDVQRDGDGFTLVRGDTAWTFEDGTPVNALQVGSMLQELSGSLIASRFVEDGDSIGNSPQGGSTVAYAGSGDVLAEVSIGSGENDLWATVTGDSVTYRLPQFRADLITPRLESIPRP